MSLLLGFFALGAVPDTVPTPVPPPVPQSVAACTAPTYASDFTVCSSSELLALDRELAALLPLPRVADVEVEGQKAWFRRSRMCASRGDQADCLRAAYAERLSIARALRGNAIEAPALVPARCRKASLFIADPPASSAFPLLKPPIRHGRWRTVPVRRAHGGHSGLPPSPARR